MEALKTKVNELDARVRLLEQDNSKIIATLEHFTSSVDNFIQTLKDHEKKEDKRFEKLETELSKLARVAYIGIGGLAIVQFLIANGIIALGGK